MREEREGDGLNHKKGSWRTYILSLQKEKKDQNRTKQYQKNPKKTKLVPMPKQINLPF